MSASSHELGPDSFAIPNEGAHDAKIPEKSKTQVLTRVFEPSTI